ncbi:MAG: hypothetical protein ACI9EH_001805 [Planktomarina sp.]
MGRTRGGDFGIRLEHRRKTILPQSKRQKMNHLCGWKGAICAQEVLTYAVRYTLVLKCSTHKPHDQAGDGNTLNKRNPIKGVMAPAHRKTHAFDHVAVPFEKFHRIYPNTTYIATYFLGGRLSNAGMSLGI